MYKLIKRCGQPVIETFENENVRITRWANGEVETEFKKGADPKVIKMYAQLTESRKLSFFSAIKLHFATKGVKK